MLVCASGYIAMDYLNDEVVRARQFEYKHTIDSLYMESIRDTRRGKLYQELDAADLEYQLNLSENEIEELDIRTFELEKQLEKCK